MGNCTSDEARGKVNGTVFPASAGEPASAPCDEPKVVVETEVEKIVSKFDLQHLVHEISYRDLKYFSLYFPQAGFGVGFLKQLPDVTRLNIFWVSVVINQIQTVRVLLDGWPDPATVTTYDGRTPLMFAALYGYQDTVDMLLARGADVNAVTNRADGEQYDALAYALGGPGNLDGKCKLQVVQTLINAGADTQRPLCSPKGYRTTHLAKAVGNTRAFGSTAVVELLLPLSDINERIVYERTPLSVAVRNIFTLSTAGTIALLLDHGADVTKFDADGLYPYQYAEKIKAFPSQLLDRLRLPPPAYEQSC